MTEFELLWARADFGLETTWKILVLLVRVQIWMLPCSNATSTFCHLVSLQRRRLPADEPALHGVQRLCVVDQLVPHPQEPDVTDSHLRRSIKNLGMKLDQRT